MTEQLVEIVQYISFSLRDMGENERECAEMLSNLWSTFLPTVVGSPLARLSYLDYKIKHDVDDTQSPPAPAPAPALKAFPKIQIIPLDTIPTVSTLTLTTCTPCVLFTRESKVGARPNRLQELRLRGCELMEAGDLHAAVESLKEVEAWEAINRVVVEGCDLLKYDRALEVNGKKKLLYLT